MRSVVSLLVGLSAWCGLLPALQAQADASRLVRTTKPLSAEAEQAALQVPPGFTVQLFASEPMINKPINMAFDDEGRLWVSSNVEYPYAASPERWEDKTGSRVRDSRDAIKILEDTDGDGQADKVTDFADGLNIPTGVLPWHKPKHHAGCIAWSIPNIWYFADTTGDGKADLREVLFGPLGYERDTHGMCSSFRMGQDGWVYATHGFNNTSHFEAGDGSALDLHSGNVFRFKPDGSSVEIWSWGQVNPFGLCWDKRGNLYSADCHSNPITQLLRGAYYPSFGKPHDGLGYGPVMCEHSHGSTGICGVVYIDGGIWGAEWEDRMLVGNCVNSRINMDRIRFSGTTPVAEELPDFLISEDPWFRPVDLQLGPDNALYVADFYNRVIGHYEVPLDHPGRDRERGRIWRIVKEDALATPRPSPPAPSAPDLADLESDDPFIRRATAAWYSEHPDLAALPALLVQALAASQEDPQLRHQLRLSIRDQLKLPRAYEGRLDWSNAAVALVQDISIAVPTEDAAEFLLAQWKQGDLSGADMRVLGHIARYGSKEVVAEMTSLARRQFAGRANMSVTAITTIHNGLLEGGGNSPDLLSWASEAAEELLKKDENASTDWEVLPHPDHPDSEDPWTLQERECADGATAQVISSLNRGKPGAEQRTGILRSRSFPAPDKLTLWICGHRGFPQEEAHEENYVRLVTEEGKELKRAYPPRNDVCQPVEWDLASFSSEPVKLEIVDGDSGKAFAWLGVTRIAGAGIEVGSFGSEETRRVQLTALAGLLRTTASVSLRDRLAAYLPATTSPPEPAKPRPELDTLLAERLAKFERATADSAKGKAVFEVNCAACHQIGGQGGLIGPQLDGIGNRGAERLLEDILDPNRNVDTHFRLHQMELQGGATALGFVRGEVGQTVILVEAAGNERRIAKGTILEDTELPASLMPPTFGQTIQEGDFVNLLAWLLQAR